MQQKHIHALAVAVSLCAATGSAFARTTPASAGRPMLGTQEGSFIAVNGSVYNPTSTGQFWVIPLEFDFAGARTVTVRGRANSGANMYCSAAFIKPDGTAVTSASMTFPANGTYTSIPLSLGSVTGGSVGAVTCFVPGPGNAILLGLDYPP